MNALIGLLVLILIVAVIWYVLKTVIDLMPIDATFKRIAQILLLLIVALVIFVRTLPLLGIAVPL